MKRRKFLKNTAGTALAFGYSPLLQADEIINEVLSPTAAEIKLSASEEYVPLLPGPYTKMLTFKGELNKGAASYLTPMDSFLGPTIEARKGDRIKVNFENNVGEESIIHWHGLHLPENQDGHPGFAIADGQSYKYDFKVENRAGLYWYHPHPHGRTGYQVYHGLAGLLVVRDDEEDALNLPNGENELFLVFQDRDFGQHNQLRYVQSGHDIMMGKVGDKRFISGKRQSWKQVKNEAYRLRCLNGGNALTYRLQWSDGRPLQIIGTDGGLLEKVEELDSVLFAPGERLDIIADFSDNSVGDEVELMSIPIVDNSNAQAFRMYKFLISEEGAKSFTMPTKLSEYNTIDPEEAVNYGSPKVFKLYPKAGIGWTIDGQKYEMDSASAKERVKLGTTEIWEFDLTNAGMIHPMHIHGSQFQVIERIHGDYSKGVVFDGGWKDTVAVLPGDRVRVIKRFNDHPGKFLYHCHILEHEDNSMMRNFVVEE